MMITQKSPFKMSGDIDSFGKLPRLFGTKDFMHRRPWMKEYIQREDIGLLMLQESPENATQSQITRWNKLSIRAKSAIILTLGAGPIAPTSSMIEGNVMSAKYFWDALRRFYKASKEQSVISLYQEIEGLTFNKEPSWEDHLNRFHEILSKH